MENADFLIQTEVKIRVTLVIGDGKALRFNYFRAPTPLAKISNLTFYKATKDIILHQIIGKCNCCCLGVCYLME